MTTVHRDHVDKVDVDPDLEGLDGYVPPPYLPPATLDERILSTWREVTRTPGRAALAALGVCALAGFLVSLRPVAVSTVDATGPLRAQCGISFYLAGASNRAVDAACQYAFSSRIPVLVLLGLVFVGSAGLLVRTILRDGVTTPAEGTGRRWRELTNSPARAALAVFELAALVAVIAAAAPVSTVTADAAGPLRASCGLQYFVFGTSNPAVQTACRHAYAPRAVVFIVMLAVLVCGALVLYRLTKPATTEPPSS